MANITINEVLKRSQAFAKEDGIDVLETLCWLF